MIDPIQHIRQHLSQRGIDIALQQFTYLPFEAGRLRYELNAYNQSLFAEVNKLPVGARIIADNNALEVTADCTSMVAWEEFSGQVTVELPAPQTGGIEFIQIVK